MKNDDSNDPMTKWRWKMSPVDVNSESTNPRRNRCFSFVVVLLIVCGCFLMLHHMKNYELTEENLDSVSWLPMEAKNISWHDTYNFRVYECDMEEDVALAFAKESGWEFQPIEESEPFEIPCYPFSSMNDRQREIAESYYSDPLNKGRIHYRVHVGQGYAYDGSSHRGGVMAAYDARHKRLFVFISRR